MDNVTAQAESKIFEDIIEETDSTLIENELLASKKLGDTKDFYSIYLVEFFSAPNTIREISRLREITFRKVGEGTGRSRDTDLFDETYKHIVLWNSQNKEIAGSYRMGICSEIISNQGIDGLYSNTTCELNDHFIPILNQSIEMGRSFIQEKYWKSNALDYMWQGIGAFLQYVGNIRYLWGSVSISDLYSDSIKKMIVYFYIKWYLGDITLATPRNEFKLTNQDISQLSALYNGKTHEEDYKILKEYLNLKSTSLPVLLRRYFDLCEFGGVKVINFNVDPDFSNCVDALILVDLNNIRDTYQDRYYKQKSFLKNH